MNVDPERWSSAESDASELERSLIVGLSAQRPDEPTRRAMYEGVMAGLGASAAGAVLATTTPAKASFLASVAKLGWLKLTVVIVAIGASSAALLWSGPAKPKRVAKGVASQVAPEKVALTPAPMPVPTAAPPAVERKTPRSDVLLMREGKLLVEARAALKANDLSRAAVLLSRAERAFPRGALRQEREVLRIQWLRARGDHAEADRRARAFVAAHPESPHAQKVLRSDAP